MGQDHWRLRSQLERTSLHLLQSLTGVVLVLGEACENRRLGYGASAAGRSALRQHYGPQLLGDLARRRPDAIWSIQMLGQTTVQRQWRSDGACLQDYTFQVIASLEVY